VRTSDVFLTPLAPGVRYGEHTIESAGVPIVLSLWDAPTDGPVLVFLPGTMTHPLFYARFCAALAEQGITVIGVHFEGHGKSPRVRRLLHWSSLEANALDAVSYVTETYHRPVVLAGSSQGGVLAITTAPQTDRLAGVIAHNVLDPSLPHSLSVSRLPAWWQPLYSPLVRLLSTAGRLAPKLPVPFQAYLDLNRVCREPWSAEAFLTDPLGLRSYPLGFLAELFSLDMTPMRDGSIRCPVLVVAATGDPLFSFEYTRLVFERLVAPRKELLTFELDHHLIFTECVDAVVDPLVERINLFTGVVPAPSARR
jgi:alpha-beta hydrolase superfamily lysophospholipase